MGEILADLQDTTMMGVKLLARFGLDSRGWRFLVLSKEHTNATFPSAMTGCLIRTMESIIHMISLHMKAAPHELETWTMDLFERGHLRHGRCPARATGMVAPCVWLRSDLCALMVVLVV